MRWCRIKWDVVLYLVVAMTSVAFSNCAKDQGFLMSDALIENVTAKSETQASSLKSVHRVVTDHLKTGRSL